MSPSLSESACYRPVEIHADVAAAIGRTPLIRLDGLFPGAGLEILAKLESLNPSGSAKDRPALAMVARALADKTLRAGGTVVESSSGNLGLALARICAAHDLRFVCVVDTRANQSTVAMIRALGAEISLVTEPDPQTGDLLTARLHRVQELLRDIPGALNLNQYANPANPRAHAEGTMREIAEATHGELDVMMTAVSSSGTLAGCVQYLRAHDMRTRTVAVDTVGSALFGGRAGPRRLPGMGAGMATPISQDTHPDAVLRVTEVQCVIGARLLAKATGIAAGGSTGGVVYALGTLARSLKVGSRVAFVVHDSGFPYVDTVYDDEWVRAELGVSPQEVDRGTAELLARSELKKSPGCRSSGHGTEQPSP